MMPKFILIVALFFFVLPILTVALSDIERMTNGRYIAIVVGSWIVALGLTALYITGQ